MQKLILKLISAVCLLLFISSANASVCSANSNGKTAICGEAVGQCFYQAIWGGPSSQPLPNNNANSACCYDPSEFECEAGAFVLQDPLHTPLVSDKSDSRTGTTILKGCGVVAIPNNATCSLEASCGVIGYSYVCPFSNVCTNDPSKCPESNSGSGSGTVNCNGESQCGGRCYNDLDNFCIDHIIYSKDTHANCNDQLLELGPSSQCCGNTTVYNPQQRQCVSSRVIRFDQGVCNGRIYELDEQHCVSNRLLGLDENLCGGTVYNINLNACSDSHVVAIGNLWSSICRQEFNPQTHECKQGSGAFPRSDMCLLAEGFFKGECVEQSRPSCDDGWTYQTRNPTKKDRCNQTSTKTASLKCRLAVGNRSKNWTGPHAQAGRDECRSTKGKNPKGVKCPAGYDLTTQTGADTCSKVTTAHETPSCPTSWKYKSRRGADVCYEQ